MATAAILQSPQANTFGSKLLRTTMMYPPQSQPKTVRKQQHPHQRPKQGEPFDPDLLCQKLQAHLTTQKMLQDQRRAMRVAKAASLTTYRQESKATTRPKVGHNSYVPKVAASAFERTTTQAIGKKHRFAEAAALKGHGVAGAMGRRSMENEVTRARNQYTWDSSISTSHEEDAPIRTFAGEFAHLKHTRGASGSGPRLSSSDDSSPIQPHTADDRPDWVQRDAEVSGTKKEGRRSPLLRKMESSWILLTKKENKQPKASNRDEAVAGIVDLESPPEQVVISKSASSKKSNMGMAWLGKLRRKESEVGKVVEKGRIVGDVA